MRHLKTLALGLLLSATMLAGCGDDSSGGSTTGSGNTPVGPGGTPVPGGTGTVTPPPEPDEGLGAIWGVVVDATVTPIEGVTITVPVSGQADPMTTKSDIAGNFAFNNLLPGPYSVNAAKNGYKSIQQTVQVVADEEPEVVKIQLVSDPDNRAYFDTNIFDGYMECSVSTAVLKVAVCAIPNEESQEVCDLTGQCVGNFTNDEFRFQFGLTAKNPQWIQSEMIWDSTQAAGSSFTLNNGAWRTDGSTFIDLAEFTGESPLLSYLDEGQINGTTSGGYSWDMRADEGDDYGIRIFTDGPPETRGVTGWGTGVTYQQQYQVYTHVFYGYKPPADWRYSADQNVPQPPN